MSEHLVSIAHTLNRLAKPLRYLYYRIYTWNLRKFGEVDVPQFNALLGTSMLMLINLLTVPLIVGQLEISVMTPATFRRLVIVLMPVIFASQYLLLFRRARYRKISEEFSNEGDASRRRGTVIVLAYVILSFGVFFGIGMIGALARA